MISMNVQQISDSKPPDLLPNSECLDVPIFRLQFSVFFWLFSSLVMACHAIHASA